MFTKELISQGWQALMRDRMRSALTMLGIVWGLASVVLLLAYGQGLGGSVLHAFLNMGNNVIVLWPGQTSMQAGGQRAGKTVHYELRRCRSDSRRSTDRARRQRRDRPRLRIQAGHARGLDSGARRRHALRADAQARPGRRPLLQRERFRRPSSRGHPRLRGRQESISGRARRGTARRDRRPRLSK